MAKKKEIIEEGGAVDETQTEATRSINRDYEEWKVKPTYDDIIDGFGKVAGRKLTGFSKDAGTFIRKTRISPDKAETLNAQSENTLLHLYEIK